MNSSKELIQILAVGVSILEDERYGVADSSRTLTADRPRAAQSKKTQASPILADIFRERLNQDAKWGPQHHTPIEWAMILVEEMGEWAGEIIEESQTGQMVDSLAWYILQRLQILEDEARRWLEKHDFDKPPTTERSTP